MTFTIFYRVLVAKKYQSFSNHNLTTRNVTKIRNTHKMNRISPLPDVKLCPFDPVFKTNSQYICYKYEKCCSQGCCSSYGFSNYHSWYFWIIIGLILLIFYLGSWYCKKMELKSKRRCQVINSSNRSSTSSSNSSPQVSPRRRPEENNVDHLLNFVINNYRFQNVNETLEAMPRRNRNVEPPPKYQEALNMPKRSGTNVQIAQIHVNGVSSTEQSQNAENSNEVPPTYEDAVQKSKETN